MKKSAGFTLIELVGVMVILAILAVIAVPQFVDLRTSASDAAVEGVAGALSSASALNFANEMANSANGIAVADCQDVEDLLQGGTLPSGYSITSAAVTPAGTVVTCTLTGTNSQTATFTAIGVQ